MKILRMVLLTILLVALSHTAWAQCPSSIGHWSTAEGTMIGGRASEAWCGGQGDQPGNMQNAMSWDGASLGTQWRAWGMTIDPVGPVLLVDNVNGDGDGIRIYSTDYVDGQYWLSKDNTWSDGVDDLTGNLTTYNVTTTVTFQAGVIVGASANIAFTGDFANCPSFNDCEISFGIANALLIWHPDFGGAMPADYPDLLCGASTGEAYDACCLTVDIYCAVGAEETTWGSLKALYK
jgi:hypothetical protein